MPANSIRTNNRLVYNLAVDSRFGFLEVPLKGVISHYAGWQIVSIFRRSRICIRVFVVYRVQYESSEANC